MCAGHWTCTAAESHGGVQCSMWCAGGFRGCLHAQLCITVLQKAQTKEQLICDHSKSSVTVGDCLYIMAHLNALRVKDRLAARLC